MRILAISGRNLASLAGEFSVDFEQAPLATAGLFAISGPTGAGKSTLLDALCLALYDATPRLLKLTRGASVLPDVGTETVSAQDPRTLLRRGCAEGHAQVDFVGNDQQRYRARWSVRRSRSRNAGALQKTTLTLHRLPGLEALGGTNTEVLRETELRIGLSFEQFTRAVLLAQNEFSAFLKTEENERGELLETLTGSDIYSQLSKRAFERFRLEEGRLQQLGARLQDQVALPADERAAIEAQALAAGQALAALESRQAALEGQLRWQEELARLDAQLAQARTALAEAAASSEDAAARRRHLALVEAVQPARPLLAEHTRLQGEHAGLLAAGEDLRAALARAEADARAAGTARAAGAAQLHAAEQAQRAAAPLLDQAKALDASIAVLLPAHQAGSEARARAHEEAAQAGAGMQHKAGEIATARAAHDSAAAWLDQHQAWEALALQWPRWDQLLGKAQAMWAQRAALDTALATAQAALAAAGAADTKALAALAACTGGAGTIDVAALLAERSAIDARRDAMAAAEKTWTTLAALREREQQEAASETRLQAELAGAQAKLAQSGAAAAACALAQAERSLEAARLACADSVASLRAGLEDGAPCPVCGSAEHPWHGQDAALQAMLAGLQGEVERCRRAAGEQLAHDAAQGAIAARCGDQLAALAGARAAGRTALAAAAAAWQAHPLAGQASGAAWFHSEQAVLREQARELALREQATHAASAAQAALGAARAREQSARQQHAHNAAALAALLAELDGVTDIASWQGAPAAFHAERAGEAALWLAQSQQRASHAAALGRLELEHAAAHARHAQAMLAAAGADAAFAGIDADIGAKRAARSALWEGRAAAQVEAQLAHEVDSARAALVQQQAAIEQAAQAETRARAALAHHGARLDTVALALAGAAQALELWLAARPALDLATLAALLATSEQARAAERDALAALDAAAARAATVAAERLDQRSAHAAAGSPSDGTAEALAALLAERAAAHEAATALRIALAQDDARRAQGAAVMEQLAAQQLVERRWGRLNELIGSSDGRKFRNYAQQFTLDVLLGYANGHLQALARRYRLERVAGGNGPSLGLMVRDMDMGGEVRSVNSLSGGESFLVSLALALGLASLSSNRVKVESLFIDEGFGSLDHDTLQVAMDALDGLQSMGRKVGVISHVQEMTERIAARIVVRPTGGGSSTVSVQ